MPWKFMLSKQVGEETSRQWRHLVSCFACCLVSVIMATAVLLVLCNRAVLIGQILYAWKSMWWATRRKIPSLRLSFTKSNRIHAGDCFGNEFLVSLVWEWQLHSETGVTPVVANVKKYALVYKAICNISGILALIFFLLMCVNVSLFAFSVQCWQWTIHTHPVLALLLLVSR